MKIVEALHKVKSLKNKIQNLQGKITKYCADMDVEKPTYGTPEQQTQQITEWLQSVHDSVKEISRLKLAIQKTNIETIVTIEIGGKPIAHSIAEWINRRVDLSKIEKETWGCLTKGSLVPQNYLPDPNVKDVMLITNPRLYYDPKLKDKKVAEYSEEPNLINSKLEIVNAVTDIVE